MCCSKIIGVYVSVYVNDALTDLTNANEFFISFCCISKASSPTSSCILPSDHFTSLYLYQNNRNINNACRV
jgi:hypothetical protein